MSLSEQSAKALKWEGKDRTYSDGNGLYLLVRRSSKTWIIRQRHGGKAKIITVGKYPALPVKEARAKAAQVAVAGAMPDGTVADLIKKYEHEVLIDHKRPHLAIGYFERAVLPKLGRRRAREVTRADVVQLVQAYKGRGIRSADQLRSQLRQLFGYALELGWCDENPVAGVTRRVSGYKPTPRARVLTDDEIRLLWAEAHPNARLLRFLLLTGVRIGEAQKASPWLVDGDEWTVPGELSKNGKAHRIYLTEAAKAELTEPFEVGPTAIQAWLRRWCDNRKIDPRFTPHDLRRTFATRLNEIGIAPHIAEKCLNHTLPGVLAVYNRAEYWEERMDAYRSVAEHISNVVSQGDK